MDSKNVANCGAFYGQALNIVIKVRFDGDSRNVELGFDGG